MSFRRVLPNRKVLAYMATTFAFSIMHNIFNFYYVKIFLNFYRVEAHWFQLSQVIYMVWNTVNDPLFGYCQDKVNWRIFKQRRLSILYGAPFFALSFLVAWLPISNDGVNVAPWVVGLHLIAALCFYDTMFTFVLLAHCCLVTEMEIDFQSRLNLKWWSTIASLCASFSVPITNQLSSNLDCLVCFRWICVGVALLAMLCMIFTGIFANTIYDDSTNSSTPEVEERNVLKLIFQIIRERNFNGFVWLNFLHQGHSAFLSNFTSIFIDFLAPGISKTFLNVYFYLYSLMPSIIMILLRKQIEQFGYYQIIKISCILKVISSLAVLMVGRIPIYYMIYLMLDNILLHSTSPLFDISLSDIADEDKNIHKRKKPISSLIFGTNALVTKPAISLFPMIAVAVLDGYGYKKVVSQTIGAASRTPNPDGSDTYLIWAMFYLSTTIPLVCGIVQLISWSFYNIRRTFIVPVLEESKI